MRNARPLCCARNPGEVCSRRVFMVASGLRRLGSIQRGRKGFVQVQVRTAPAAELSKGVHNLIAAMSTKLCSGRPGFAEADIFAGVDAVSHVVSRKLRLRVHPVEGSVGVWHTTLIGWHPVVKWLLKCGMRETLRHCGILHVSELHIVQQARRTRLREDAMPE
eukprot:774459-Rhodomonas_salina.1